MQNTKTIFQPKKPEACHSFKRKTISKHFFSFFFVLSGKTKTCINWKGRFFEHPPVIESLAEISFKNLLRLSNGLFPSLSLIPSLSALSPVQTISLVLYDLSYLFHYLCVSVPVEWKGHFLVLFVVSISFLVSIFQCWFSLFLPNF